MTADLLCFSHLRWAFVTQRPNHLMMRAARDRRVFFIEEPIIDEGPGPHAPIEVTKADGVTIVRPHIPADVAQADWPAVLRARLDLLTATYRIRRPVRWYYTPMALPWSEHVPAAAVVYDCMDELSAFTGAPADLVALEQRLLAAADLVFTGGHSLYQAKRRLHPDVSALPSSVDATHFRRARVPGPEPEDQAGIRGPRIGWFGVIDERFDMDLVEAVADTRPDWQLVLLGPFTKIDEATVPQRPNLHWLGQKAYADLPAYLRGWDVAIMPFARNASTRYISPTKTPEYLAAGRPVVSTSITDVIDPYARLDLVRIADEPGDFVTAVEAALCDDRATLRRHADAFLATTSWDATWAKMASRLDAVTAPVRPSVPATTVPAGSLPAGTLPSATVPAAIAGTLPGRVAAGATTRSRDSIRTAPGGRTLKP